MARALVVSALVLASMRAPAQGAAAWRDPSPHKVRFVPVEKDVRLEVLDSGPGIHPNVLPRIFEAFTTTKAPGEGTGLGLWVSYSIVEQHQGSLRAVNRPEGGAAFIVELPAATG